MMSVTKNQHPNHKIFFIFLNFFYIKIIFLIKYIWFKIKYIALVS